MSETIRTVRVDEIKDFHKFLGRGYGVDPHFFCRIHPDLYPLPSDTEVDDYCLVMERDGKIVSHVGAFPMPFVLGPARVMCGGIGGVTTLPEERGRGYMSQLMQESIRRMREKGWVLSWLGGDRLRYRHFGYETCGIRTTLEITRRSLEAKHVAPVEIEEVDTKDPEVVERVRALHETLGWRIDRCKLDRKLQRQGVRVFLGPDGYVIPGEVVSPTGREAELILAYLDWTFESSLSIGLEPGDDDRATRLIDVCQSWSCGPQGMFRILDWFGLLTALKPLLAERAQALPPFSIAIGCRWQEEVDTATITWSDRRLEISRGRQASHSVEIDEPDLVALLLGGPHRGLERLGLFGRLLPIDFHLGALDGV